MRTVNFRDDVLWAVARKMRIDPATNLLPDQAQEYANSINAWVRRTWDAQDWQEWTELRAFTPNASTHMIDWEAVPAEFVGHTNSDAAKIGKVLHVYLLDPRTTAFPADILFSETSTGIFVGTEHGATVFVKFIPRCPVFTADEWTAGRVYQKGELAYSPRSGECYKSKSVGNRGHDPSVFFSLPPIPVVLPPPRPAPTVEVTQAWTPDNPGMPERNQTSVISFVQTDNGMDIPDPVPDGHEFYVDVWDGPNESFATFLGDADYLTSGATPLFSIIPALVTLLQAEPLLSAFTITGDVTAKTITLEGPQPFYLIHGTFILPGIGNLRYLKRTQVEAYIPTLSAASGQPQITRLTINDATTYPGSTYSLTVTGSDGVEHTVSYASNLYDNSAQILQGLILAMEASTDTFWEAVQLAFDPDALTLDISIRDVASVQPDAPAPPAGGAWWELVPFPFALVDQVVRGVYADSLKGEGQADKAAGEEQAVPIESQVRSRASLATGSDTLTDQIMPAGRYK